MPSRRCSSTTRGASSHSRCPHDDRHAQQPRHPRARRGPGGFTTDQRHEGGPLMPRELPPATRRTPYIETFDEGGGGWYAWIPAAQMPSPSDESTIDPDIRDGAFPSESPWWVDSNHAPPG